MEKIEEHDREETNEDIARLVLEPYKKVRLNPILAAQNN